MIYQGNAQDRCPRDALLGASNLCFSRTVTALVAFLVLNCPTVVCSALNYIFFPCLYVSSHFIQKPDAIRGLLERFCVAAFQACQFLGEQIYFCVLTVLFSGLETSVTYFAVQDSTASFSGNSPLHWSLLEREVKLYWLMYGVGLLNKSLSNCMKTLANGIKG